MKWFPEVDDATVEQERRTSWPQALAVVLVMAVVCGAVSVLLTWALGVNWGRGAVAGFGVALLSYLFNRFLARRERR